MRRFRVYLLGSGLGAGLIRAVAGSGLVSVLGMALTFLVGIQLARGLGVEGYGTYGIAMAVVAILGVPSQFGVPQLMVREVSAHAANTDWRAVGGMLTWSWKTLLTACLVVVAVFLAWLAFVGPANPSQTVPLLLASLLIPLGSVVTLQGATLRGLMHIVKAQFPDTLLRPLTTALLLGGLAMFSVQLSPALAIIAGIVSACFAVVVGWLLMRRHLPAESRSAGRLDSAHGLLSASFAMAMSEGLRVIPVHATVIVLGMIASLTDVGQFRVATSVAALLAFPLAIFNMVVAPAVSRLLALGDRVRLQRLLSYASAGMLGSVILLALPFLLMGEPILQRLFGKEFGNAAGMVAILAFGYLAAAAFGVGGTLLSMAGRQARVTSITAVSVVVLSILLWPLVRWGGGDGAACAVAISLCVSSGLFWLDAKRNLGVDSSLVALYSILLKRAEQ